MTQQILNKLYVGNVPVIQKCLSAFWLKQVWISNPGAVIELYLIVNICRIVDSEPGAITKWTTDRWMNESTTDLGVRSPFLLLLPLKLHLFFIIWEIETNLLTSYKYD